MIEWPALPAFANIHVITFLISIYRNMYILYALRGLWVNGCKCFHVCSIYHQGA